jgi:hypothetical protein
VIERLAHAAEASLRVDRDGQSLAYSGRGSGGRLIEPCDREVDCGTTQFASEPRHDLLEPLSPSNVPSLDRIEVAPRGTWTRAQFERALRRIWWGRQQEHRELPVEGLREPSDLRECGSGLTEQPRLERLGLHLRRQAGCGSSTPASFMARRRTDGVIGTSMALRSA